MESKDAAAAASGFKILGVDGVVYGPVELPTLISWVKDERVTASTWVYHDQEDAWRKAAYVPELRMFFKTAAPAPAPGDAARAPGLAGVKAGSLRRVKIFADFSEAQLERFIGFMEIERVKQFTEIVKQGQFGESMYFVMEGELRVRLLISGKESTLVTLGAGEFFGEIALFDQGPRSADVVANTDSVLLKISADKFKALLSQAPELAAPFLFAVGKTLTARIRADNKRYRDSVSFARAAGR